MGVVAGPDGGGVVWVHGLATFAWDAGDEAARRLAAVQLVRLNAATQVQVAQAFGVIPVSVWRWAKALAGGGVAGLVPAGKGPQRASKLTPQVIGADPGAGPAGRGQGRDRRRDRGVGILGPQRAPPGPAGARQARTRAGSLRQPEPPRTARGSGRAERRRRAASRSRRLLPVLPDPVPRDGERALARFGLLGEGAAPVFTPGARYPLAGLLLALPPLAAVRAAGLRPAGLRAAPERVLRPGGRC